MKNNKKAFTLVELLAVIIILGIIFVIAVPSISGYIEDSRESTYIRSAKEYVDAVRLMIASKDISAKRTDTTYYIPIEYIKTDRTADSPYGKWVKAYVVLIYKNSVYEYYWTSVDETGHRIELTPVSELTKNKIETGGNKNIVITKTVGGTSKVYLMNKDLKFQEVVL